MKPLISTLVLLAGMAFGQTAPTITTQPQNKAVQVGQKATFSVVASNATAYQWLINGNPISGATATSYTTNQTTKGDNGASFSVRVSNAAGSVVSNTVKLTVAPYVATTIDKGLTTISTYNANLSGIAGCDKLTCSSSFNAPAGAVSVASIFVTATVTGPHSVDLKWNPSTSPGVTMYFVYRTLSAGRIASVPGSSTTFTDLTVGAGVTYYVVTAYTTAGGESAFSNTAQAVIPTP